MPNVHNHSKKFIYTNNVYSRNESVKRDVERLYGITCQLADTSNKRRKITVKDRRSLQREAKKHCIAAFNNLSMAQIELSSLDDLKYCNNLFNAEFGHLQEEDGTFPTGEELLLTPDPKQPTTRSMTQMEQVSRKKKEQNPVTPEYPKPTNGVEYRNPMSIVKALESVTTPFRKRVRQSMPREEFVTKIKDRQMRKYFQRFRDGLPIPKLFGKGMTCVAYVKDVMTDLRDKKGANNSDGITVSPDDIAESVQAVATSGKAVSKSTIRRLINAIKQLFEGRVKTASRQLAEVSIRPLPTLIHVVAGTHFIVCENGIGDSSIKTASEGAKLLYNLVSEYHNDAALRVVKPQLVFSTDDSAIFASKLLNSNESNMWNI
ncbi:predicted protein [Chaetoceros tenuissimus]|uniref:Uncharacterized protein n=1 Tax=Chaetoceros tenuissimus TaxID=426638 RepID=A0AAD3CR54_9STRA|nr:predicted protein [Chaetoceros tenuissimus]